MIYIKNNTDTQMISIPRGVVAPSSSVTEYATEAYVDNAIADAISGITGVNYTAGENIDITNDRISVTGITSYTGITSQEIITALGYTPCKVIAMTESDYTNLQTKDANTIYGIIE